MGVKRVTTTVAPYSSETDESVQLPQRRGIYPLIPASATAGTGITGGLLDFPSLSMTHLGSGQSCGFYTTRQEKTENTAEITTRIFWQSREQLEPDSTVGRGTFTLPYHRKVLFSESVEIQTFKLPRWKPRVTIDRRVRERAEDE
jgi:hypothetical protein